MWLMGPIHVATQKSSSAERLTLVQHSDGGIHSVGPEQAHGFAYFRRSLGLTFVGPVCAPPERSESHIFGTISTQTSRWFYPGYLCPCSAVYVNG